MTPKEKAKELVLKFAFKGAQHEGESKKFVLIAIDEIRDLMNRLQNYELAVYWKEVKEEIEKL